jgi:phosphoglycolate phosphatase-like HAD superfamily hydrolase
MEAIFDCDGTLVDSLGLHLEGLGYAIRTLGKEAREEEIIARCFNRPNKVIAEAYGIDLGKFTQLYEWHVKQGYGKLSFFPDVLENFSMLKERNVGLGICTLTRAELFSAAIESLGLESLVDTIVSNGASQKSKTELLGMAIKGKPEDTFFIGDSPGDMRASQAVGTIGILFHPKDYSRYYNLDEIMQYNPQYTAHSHSEIRDILSKSI